MESLTLLQGNVKTTQNKEFSEKGKVKRDVYLEYAKESNIVAVSIYLVMLLGAQTATIGMSSPCLPLLFEQRTRTQCYYLQHRTCSVFNTITRCSAAGMRCLVR